MDYNSTVYRIFAAGDCLPGPCTQTTVVCKALEALNHSSPQIHLVLPAALATQLWVRSIPHSFCQILVSGTRNTATVPASLCSCGCVQFPTAFTKSLSQRPETPPQCQPLQLWVHSIPHSFRQILVLETRNTATVPASVSLAGGGVDW